VRTDDVFALVSTLRSAQRDVGGMASRWYATQVRRRNEKPGPRLIVSPVDAVAVAAVSL
jgi:hypothetical protein